MINNINVKIAGVGAFAPQNILTNADLEKMVDTSDEWITSRTGISNRHILEPDKATSDIAYNASIIALKRAGISAKDLDLIIVATVSPDRLIPACANILQHKLGAKNAASFDISAACTGFIYALSLGVSHINSGLAKNVLVVGAEALSRFINYEDRSTCVIFGDGGGAAVLTQAALDERGFLDFHLGSDGSSFRNITIPHGGSELPLTRENIDNKQHFIHMEGSEVFKFAVKVLVDSAKKILTKNNLTTDDVDILIPHQANLRIIDAAGKRLHIPENKWIVNIQEYGNTSAGSIPICLNEAYEQGKLKKGDLIMLIGFGGGLTWGSSLLYW